MDNYKYNPITKMVEHISVQRGKVIDDAVLGEINQIAKDNEIFTTITLNEKAIVEALRNAIPGKPHLAWDSMTRLHSCPACIMSVSESDAYCSKCGKNLIGVIIYER